jgi:hypothetical protein
MRKTMGVCLAIAASAAMVLLNAQTWQWAKGFGATVAPQSTRPLVYSIDGIKGVATDAQGNIYVTGYYTGHVSIGGQALDSIGGQDFFIAKFNSAGTVQWAKYAGTSGGGGNDSAFAKNDVGLAITLDASGNIYCCGFVSPMKAVDVVDFGNNQRITFASGMGKGDAFVVKYNSTGVAQWAKAVAYEGTEIDPATGISAGPGGFVYISGYFSGTALTVPGLTSTIAGRSAATDMFIIKIDGTTGTAKWAKALGARWEDYGWGVACDQTNGIYLAGDFKDTLLQKGFGPTAVTIYARSVNKSTDACIVKYDSAGVFKFAKAFGDSGYDCAKGITVSPSGNVYVTGHIEKRAIFSPSLTVTSAGTRSVITAKYNGADLTPIWAKAIGDAASTGMQGLNIIVNGNRAIVGGIGTIRFTFASKTFPAVNSTYGAIIAAYDTLGAEKWATVMHGNNDDSTCALGMVGDSVYAGGTFKSDTLKFGTLSPVIKTLRTSPGSSYYSNMFLARLTQPANSIIFDLSSSRGSAPITLRSGAELQVITKGLSGSAMVRLMDAQGRVAAMRKIAKDGTASLSISTLSNGMYLVQVVNGDAVLATQKCLIGAR